MKEEIYFFDSYAIIEILLENKNYLKYKDAGVILTKLNLFEVYYHTLKDFGEEKASAIINKYYPLTIEYNKEIIAEAAKFRLQYKKQDLSMTDCIGYIIAKRLNIKFLTGDKEFQNMPNVEFVK